MAHTGLQNPQCTLETLRHCQGIKPMYQNVRITGEAPPATGARRSFRPVSRRNGKPRPLTQRSRNQNKCTPTSSRDHRDDPVGALFALPFP